ncbi:hypothetical protein AUR64_08315 [Haloprofundus marisrubri]|uniref:Uncharacterized protein n=1 Tax=Haloprofundus marisrubri TaxID=1514971 RepID=A0A0W1R8F6_9EURY|nr:hypothetical protein AUR64_08315 [Haloprofundus marisrubri]
MQFVICFLERIWTNVFDSVTEERTDAPVLLSDVSQTTIVEPHEILRMSSTVSGMLVVYLSAINLDGHNI